MAKYIVELKRDFESAVDRVARQKGMSKEDVILRALATYVVDSDAESKPPQNGESEAGTQRELAVSGH